MKKTILFLFVFVLVAINSINAQDESKEIFVDGFSKNQNNWREASDMYFSQGAYHIHNNEIGKLSFKKLQDRTMPYRSIEVIAIFREGLTNQGYGVFFAASDINNGYMFLIAAEGYYSFGRLVNGVYSKLIDWTPNANIRKKDKNWIRIDYSAEKIAIYIVGLASEHKILEEYYSLPIDGGVGFYSAKGVHSSYELLKVQDHNIEWEKRH